MSDRKFIKIKVCDSSEYVEVDDEMLSNHELFVRHVLETFNLDPTQAASAFLFDQDNFRIPVELFSVVISKFLDPSVYLKMTFNFHENSGLDMELSDFLKKNSCKSIFAFAAEATKQNKELDVKSIHFLSEKLVHFMDYRATLGNKLDAEQIADSLVRLMPCIKMETLYTGRKGILYNKLFYRRYGKKQAKDKPIGHASNECPPNDDQIEDETDENITEEVEGNIVEAVAKMTLEDELSCLLFFKTCLISRDKEILKIKLRQTISLREATIRKRETKFIESFPFYFVSPDLIMYDYNIRFGNESALTKKWSAVKIKILSVLSSSYIVECEKLGFDVETVPFLVLLRNFSMAKSFDRNVEKLIIYSDNVNESPENLIDKKRIHPYIIAVGLEKENITNYYIDIENHLIPVPNEYDFLHTFDMFIKCHKVFHIEYDPGFIKLMHFVDFYVFENTQCKEHDITVTMEKTAEKLGLK